MAALAPLRVVVAHRPPFVFVNDSSGINRYYGMLIDLLSKILLSSNLTSVASPTYYPAPINAGGALTNGTWTGVIGELVAGRADVALFPLTRTAARLEVIDCTFSYLDEGLAMLVKHEHVTPGPLSVLAPFTTTLWVLLLCTVFAVSLLFWLLDAYGRYVRRKEAESLDGPSGAFVKALKGRRSHVLVSLMAAAGAPETPDRSGWGVQVLYIVYCFWCLIVLSAYTANLTSYLAVQQTITRITGMEDLLRDNLLLGVNPNGSTAAYFASSYDTLATQLQPNVRYCETPTCIEWLRGGEVAAFVTDRPQLAYLANLHPCDLTVAGDDFGPGNLVIGLRKGSPLLEPFNVAIQRFAEDGTLTSLRRSWFDGLSQCGDVGDSQLDNSRLGITQLLGVFVFLGIGVVLAFATGTVENLRWCLKRRYPELARKPSAYLAQTWDRASSSLRLRRSNTGSSSDKSHGVAAPTAERTRRKSNLGGGSVGGGGRRLAAPPLSRAPHVGISVHVGDSPGVLLSVDVDGSPCVSTAASTVYDAPSVRQSLALPSFAAAATSLSNGAPAPAPSPFATASAAADGPVSGVGAGVSDVPLSRVGQLSSSGAAGAVRKGEAGPAPALPLHRRWAPWLMGRWTNAKAAQARSGDSRSSGSHAQLLRRGSSSQRNATHAVVPVPPPPPQQQQAQQAVQQQAVQQAVQTRMQRGVIVLGEQGWGQRTLAGRLEPLLPLPPPQQQQQQALTANVNDISPTTSLPSRASQTAGERPVGLRRQQQQQRPLIDLSACGSLASAASSSYGAFNGVDAHADSTMVYNNFPPSPRSPRADASEAALS